MSTQSRILDLPQSGGIGIHAQATAIGSQFADFVARRPASVIGACALILIILVWSSTLAQVEIDRQETLETLRRSDATLTRAVAEHTVRTLKGADQALLLLKRHYEKSDARVAIGDYARSLVVGRVFSQLGAVDEHGSLLLGSTPDFTPGELFRSENFRLHAARDTGELHVGTPVPGLAAGTTSMHLTRRVNKPDGSFGGVAMIAIDPQYFSRVYGELDLGHGSAAFLIGTDGIVRARRAPGVAKVGENISGSLLAEHMRLGDVGSFRQFSPGADPARHMSYRKLAEYPLAVAVSRREDEVFKPFNGRQQWYITAGIVASLLILAYSILAVRLIRARRSNLGVAAASLAAT